MNPRLKTSAKFTAMPAELMAQVREVFAENFAEFISKDSAKLIVDGRIYPHELLFRVGYLAKGRLRQANFEVSLDFNAAKQNALQQIHFVVDCAASFLQEYLEDSERDLDALPHQWQEHEVEGKKIFLQVSTENTDLEAEANRLLGISSGDDLVQIDDDEAVLKEAISMLGLDKDDDDEDPLADDSKAVKKGNRAGGPAGKKKSGGPLRH